MYIVNLIKIKCVTIYNWYRSLSRCECDGCDNEEFLFGMCFDCFVEDWNKDE